MARKDGDLTLPKLEEPIKNDRKQNKTTTPGRKTHSQKKRQI